MGNGQLCFHSVSVSGLLLFPCFQTSSHVTASVQVSTSYTLGGDSLLCVCGGGYISVCTCVHRYLAFYVGARELDSVLMLVEQALCQVGHFPAFTT